MSALVERVRRTLRRHDLVPSGSAVVVAVSGGSDSVALLYLLLELRSSGGFRVAALAHVHHGLRGAAADEDADFCRDLADRVGVPAIVERVDVRAAATHGRSLEDAARELRYAALSQAADAVGADRVAVGHTLDDQAETVLMKLARGAGLRGLGGIHPQRGRVIRPLLDCRRAELRAWLEARGITFVEDASNADRRHVRNRFRHDVLPALREASGGGVDAVLGRAAEIARLEDAFLAGMSTLAAAKVITADAVGRVRVDVAALAEQPAALQRRIVLSALQQAGAKQPGLAAVDATLAVVLGAPGVDLAGGVRADRIGSEVVLEKTAVRAGGPPPAPFRYELSVPGRIRLVECGRELTAAIGWPEPMSGGAPQVALDRSSIAGGLWVRSWRAGDWLRPVGLGGRKKVQDVFVDRKVPRADRARVPLVVGADDHVIWVPGHAVDEGFRATASTGDVVVLTVTELGGRE